MTPSQLSAIRERLDAASVVRALMFVNMEASDLRALLDEVERLKAELDVSDSDDRLAVKRLTAEVERLTAWQVAVADGLGYANHAEGQGGYEVADPETVIGAWREQEREVERLTNDLAMARQVSGELCEACGWAMRFPGESCRCELVKWRDEWEAFKAHTMEQGASSFARGAEAMRTALLQRVSWGSDLADRIRDEPVPEDQ